VNVWNAERGAGGDFEIRRRCFGSERPAEADGGRDGDGAKGRETPRDAEPPRPRRPPSRP